MILAVESGRRESTGSWRTVLRDLQRRGLPALRVVVGDGHLGIWGALSAVFPMAAEQRCCVHRLLNLLDKVPTRLHAEAKSLLTKIPYAETREGAERQKRAFQAWATKRGVATVGQALDQDIGSRLGAPADLLSVSEGALEASPDDQSDQVTVCRGPAANDRGQAIQASGERHGGHLEDPAGGAHLHTS